MLCFLHREYVRNKTQSIIRWVIATGNVCLDFVLAPKGGMGWIGIFIKWMYQQWILDFPFLLLLAQFVSLFFPGCWDYFLTISFDSKTYPMTWNVWCSDLVAGHSPHFLVLNHSFLAFSINCRITWRRMSLSVPVRPSADAWPCFSWTSVLLFYWTSASSRSTVSILHYSSLNTDIRGDYREKVKGRLTCLVRHVYKYTRHWFGGAVQRHSPC